MYQVVEKLILSHGHKPIVYPYDNRDQKIEIIKKDEKPKKCKPSKIRILQKTTLATAKCKKVLGDDKGSRDHHHLATAQPHQHSSMYRATSNREANNNINGIRMCSDCHTTTTPLWRSGPQGPKSLCNACGIRQRKARRAAMAAATAGFTKDTTIITSSTIVEPPKLVVEDISSENKLPLKKRSKTFSTSWSYNDNNYINNNNNNNNNGDNNNNIFVDNHYRGEEKHNFEDIALSSRSKSYSKANSSQRVFPRDEEEGAILLMALSCGLACSS
ncbi:hypothetical protein KSS87_018235 [Heliosperma pusillum]|nr:hypothetical protein KSS87_018235 [Heliosperma pusillum]